MANAMDRALSRIAQSKEFQQAQETLKNSGVTPAANDNSQVRLAASNAERTEQVVAEAKQNIPAATMKDVAEHSAPLSTPPNKRANPIGLDNKRVDIETQSNIEKIEQSPSNNHRKENAMDRAMARIASQSQEQTPAREQVKTR
jgi:hypothetical protein